MVDGFAKTPRYVLKDGSHPTSPLVSQASTDAHATVIFGFSDKPEYDAFLSTSKLELTPYPLVKRFLKFQCDLEDNSLKLVVLDAVSAEQACFYAATFESALESLEHNSASVRVSHRLIREETSSDYRIEALALESLPKSVS